MAIPGRLERWLEPLRDPALGACALLASALLLLAQLPSLPFGVWLSSLCHLALVWLVLTVLGRRRAVAPRSGEKGFWTDLIWAVAIWMSADVLLVVAEASELSELAVATRSAGAAAWLAVWLASAQNPHRRGYWRPRKVERRLHVVGAAVVALGSMAYVVWPTFSAGIEQSKGATWLALLIFAVLVSSRLVFLFFEARDDRWRGVYGALATAAALVTWSHAEALLGPEPVSSAVLGGPWSALALTLLVVAARLDQMHSDDETGATLGDPIEEGPQQLEAPYLALAVAAPLAHYAAYRSGLLDPALEPQRERLMLLWAVALAMVSVYQQRRLEKWARRTLDERSRLERSLQTSRRRLQMMEEKENAEDAMQRTKQIYTKAFRDSPWAVVLTSEQDGRHLQCNDRYLETIGYPRHEVIGRTTLELGIWVDAEERGVMVEELARTGAVRAFEFTFRRRDGEQRPALFSAEHVEIDGRACLLSVSRDLGDIRLAERRERLLAAILDSLPCALFRLDLDDRVQAVNPAAERLAGPGADQRGRPLVDVLGAAVVGPGPLAGPWRRALRAAVENGWFTGQLPIDAGAAAPAVVTLARDPYGSPTGKLLFLRLAGS